MGTAEELAKKEAENYAKLLSERQIRPTSIRVFLSFKKAEDGEVAGNIKEQLENYGLEVFVAHDDIEPSREWEVEIISQIKGCDVFIPLLTANFRKSDWTDQEIGIAIGQGKHIIPISNDTTPYGFIGKYQALRLGDGEIEKDCLSILKAILLQPFLKEKVKDCLIIALDKTFEFHLVAKIFDLLQENFAENFTKEQINEIFRVAATSQPVYRCRAAKPILKAWMEKYSSVIDGRLKDLLLEKWGK